MKKVLFLIALPLFAEISFGGELKFYNRYLVEDSSRWVLNRAEFNLNTEADLSDHLHIKIENTFTSENFPAIFSITDLSEDEKIDPVAYSLGDAYVDIYGFMISNLDLRIGRQTINWGTADKINPTSNLNPYDFDDFLSFGNRLPVNAIRAFYTTDPVSLELGFVPIFKPSFIPTNEYTEKFFRPSFPGARSVESFIERPDEDLSGSSLGIRVSGNLSGWDLSVSFYDGFMKFPLPDSIIVTPHDSLSVDIKSYMSFPAIRVLGLDFSGSVMKVGLWGELGVFFPEEHVLEKRSLYGVEKDTTLKDAYVKYVVGADYTFKDGTYMNFQFIHGFISEFGDSLNDYVTFRVEHKFFNDRVKIAPLGFALEVPDWSSIKDNYGYVLNPSIRFTPFDDIELEVGGFIIDGRGENTFSRIKDVDEIYLKVKVSY